MGRDSNGAVALHYGAKSGNIDIVKNLYDCYPDAIFVEDSVRFFYVIYVLLLIKLNILFICFLELILKHFCLYLGSTSANSLGCDF